MKKIIGILLSFLILLSTIGVSVSRHYCGNILVDTAIFSHAQGCGDMDDMPMDCCHDEIDHYELSDDFQTTQFSFELDQKFEYSSHCYVSYIEHISEYEDVRYLHTDPPLPLAVRPSIYIQVQSFLL